MADWFDFTVIDWVVVALTMFSAGLVVYHHVGHPLVQKLVCRMLPAPVQPDFAEELPDETLPFISVMMPAYNEAAHIRAKLENLIALDYPTDRLDITIVCDGCQDDTAMQIRAFIDNAEGLDCFAINLVEYADNAGKLQRLNQTIPTLAGDIVVLTDVSAILSLDCMRRLASWMMNPAIGGVTGQYHLLQAGGAGQQAYWDYQVEIKKREDRMGSVLGAHGAFYGFRKSAFAALPPDTINDDFILPMNIVRQGISMRYDQAIAAVEKEVVGDADEQSRRVRIAMGNLQQTIRLRSMLHPRYRWVAYNFAAGKALRSICPVLILLVLLGSIWLSFASQLFLLLAAFQIFIYISVYCDKLHTERVKGTSSYKLGALTYLLVGHWAGVRAAWRFISDRNQGLRWS